MTTGERGPEPVGRSVSSASLPAFVPGSLVQVRIEWIGFCDAHYHRVVRFVMLNGASQADAQDATQEAFVESWALMNRDPSRWQAISGKAAWIRRVALRRYRRPPGPRRRLLAEGGEMPDVAAPGPGHEELTVQAQFVLRALRTLDEEARIVMAFELDGIPTADIAEALGITQQRVRDTKKRARRALKKELAGNVTPGGGIYEEQ